MRVLRANLHKFDAEWSKNSTFCAKKVSLPSGTARRDSDKKSATQDLVFFLLVLFPLTLFTFGQVLTRWFAERPLENTSCGVLFFTSIRV